MNGTIEITGPYLLLCDLRSKALVKVAINPFDLKRRYTRTTRGEVILIWPDPTPIPWPRCPFTIDERPSVLVPLLNLYTLWERAWSICVTALPTCACVGCKAVQQQLHHLLIKASLRFGLSIWYPTTSEGILTWTFAIIHPWPFCSWHTEDRKKEKK